MTDNMFHRYGTIRRTVKLVTSGACSHSAPSDLVILDSTWEMDIGLL